MVRGAARMCEQHIVVWQYIFVLVPPITSSRLGMEFFHTLYVQITWWLITETRKWVEGDSLVSAKMISRKYEKCEKDNIPISGRKDKK